MQFLAFALCDLHSGRCGSSGFGCSSILCLLFLLLLHDARNQRLELPCRRHRPCSEAGAE